MQTQVCSAVSSHYVADVSVPRLEKLLPEPRLPSKNRFAFEGFAISAALVTNALYPFPVDSDKRNSTSSSEFFVGE